MQHDTLYFCVEFHKGYVNPQRRCKQSVKFVFLTCQNQVRECICFCQITAIQCSFCVHDKMIASTGIQHNCMNND